jgi:nicotinate dehydrogenase subunit B
MAWIARAVVGPVGNVNEALASAAHVLSGTYKYAYQIHAPIGPQCAVADVTPDGCRIFTYNQGPTSAPASIAGLLGLPANKVRVTVVAGLSLYGGGVVRATLAAGGSGIAGVA